MRGDCAGGRNSWIWLEYACEVWMRRAGGKQRSGKKGGRRRGGGARLFKKSLKSYVVQCAAVCCSVSESLQSSERVDAELCLGLRSV